MHNAFFTLFLLVVQILNTQYFKERKLNYRYSPKNVYTIPKIKHMEQMTVMAMSYSAVISAHVCEIGITWSLRVVPLVPSVEEGGRVSYGWPGVAGGMA